MVILHRDLLSQYTEIISTWHLLKMAVIAGLKIALVYTDSLSAFLIVINSSGAEAYCIPMFYI